jgi:hypothetical protein
MLRLRACPMPASVWYSAHSAIRSAPLPAAARTAVGSP